MVAGIRLGRNRDISKYAVIGADCKFDRGVLIGGSCVIGNHVTVNRGSLLFCGVVGNFSSIGYMVQIGPPQHDVDGLLMSHSRRASALLGRDLPQAGSDLAKPPALGRDVWVGSSSVILQGVTIGDGAVVGAGAIVTKDIPAFAVVVGAPASVVRYRWGADVEMQRQALELMDSGQ